MKRHQIILLVILFVLALGIRVAYQSNLNIDRPIRADAAKYVNIANNLIISGVYSEELDATRPSYFITPGYPLFLAAVIKLAKNGGGYNAILFSQAVLGAFTAILAVLIALYFLPFRFAYLAGILTSISPHLITLGGYVLTETLFTSLLMLALWILLRGLAAQSLSSLAFSGLLFGAAALVRPVIIAFPLFVFPLLLQSQMRNWRMPAVLLLTALITFGTWVGWTKLHSDISSKSPSLLSNSVALGIYPDLTFQDPRMKGYPYREDPDYQKFANDLHLTLLTLGERFQSEPLRYLTWYLFGKPVMFWSKSILVGQGGIYVYPVVRTLYDVSLFAGATMKVMQFLHPYLLLSVLVGVPCAYWLRRLELVEREQLNMVTIIYVLLFYATLMHMALAPLPRYSIPFRPVLYIAFATSLFFVEVITKRIISSRAIATSD